MPRNNGRAFAEPNLHKELHCGICGVIMSVKRGIPLTTNFAEALAGKKHLCDLFECPHRSEAWHRRVLNLWQELGITKNQKTCRAIAQEIKTVLKENDKF